jgi:hypothetical protein
MAAAVVAPGCGGDDEQLPGACRAGPAKVTAALERAPRPVAVDGVRLSRCLTESSDPSDIQAVGATYVSVAGTLADAARARPEGPEAVRLGYLVGAAERGAKRTQGIHSEMVHRLQGEPAVLEGRSSAYRRGHRAGRRSG